MADIDVAPVALFVFNRPHLTAQVYERVRQARPRRLLVVADGPRASRPDDPELCKRTREVVSSPDWPCELLTNFSEANLGCRRRMGSGLDWVFQQCPEAIILEDDCLPSPSFFRFCSEMLRKYRTDTRIMHVSGDNFQDGRHRGSASYFFSRYPLSWGWASWSRAWRHYDINVSSWPAAYREHLLESILDDSREIQHWESIFDSAYRGKIDTWDYQWVYACWRNGGLAIQPNENLVSNIGMGPDATHFKSGHSTLGIPTGELDQCTHPAAVMRDEEADRYTFQEHIAGKPSTGGNWLLRTKRNLAVRTRMKRLLPRSWRYRTSLRNQLSSCPEM
jgi:hypothetical protein